MAEQIHRHDPVVRSCTNKGRNCASEWAIIRRNQHESREKEASPAAGGTKVDMSATITVRFRRARSFALVSMYSWQRRKAGDRGREERSVGGAHRCLHAHHRATTLAQWPRAFCVLLLDTAVIFDLGKLAACSRQVSALLVAKNSTPNCRGTAVKRVARAPDGAKGNPTHTPSPEHSGRRRAAPCRRVDSAVSTPELVSPAARAACAHDLGRRASHSTGRASTPLRCQAQSADRSRGTAPCCSRQDTHQWACPRLRRPM